MDNPFVQAVTPAPKSDPRPPAEGMELESLIDQLQPTRTYDRPYEQLVDDLRNRKVLAWPGRDHPILTDAETKKFIKGTSRTANKITQSYNAELIVQTFAERMDQVEEWFFEALEKTRDARLFRIYYERVAGSITNGNTSMPAEGVLELLQAAINQSRTIVIDQK